MQTVLLVVSLLLHGITIIALITLSFRVSKTKELELKQQKVAREIEETFSTYLLEVKEENERLLNMLEQSGQTVMEKHQESNVKTAEPTKVQQPNKMVEITPPHHDIQEKTEKEIKETKVYSHYEPPLPAEQEDTFEESLESNMYRLYDEGYSREEIAKKLNCGKTEVELMLKFHPRKS